KSGPQAKECQYEWIVLVFKAETENRNISKILKGQSNGGSQLRIWKLISKPNSNQSNTALPWGLSWRFHNKRDNCPPDVL
ncbi:hypothetical protein HAX54_041120, partial [Datura stramonium]|nr:hypothetical protein [Datura stramonium]